MENLYLVTGMSGSGVSTIMSILEDIGFYCVEKIPCEIIENFASILKQNKFKNVAIATSISDLTCVNIQFERNGLSPRIILVEADNSTILKRYKLTRHLHPKVIQEKFTTLEEAIENDREEYNNLPIFENVLILNTEIYSQTEIKEILKEASKTRNKKMLVVFQVFGYKHEFPKDADLVIDTRMLPNPFWVPELKEKTGDDKEVYDYVINSDKTKTFLEKLINYLNYILETYKEEERTHVTIAVGCTGGQHRSLSVAKYLMNYYSSKYECIVKKRRN